MNLFCTADAIDSSNESPMGSFCITARSPAAGRQKLDIGSGNRIGTIRQGKLKSRGVCSPIRQGCSWRRRGRWAKVKGAPTSQPCLVTYTSKSPVCNHTKKRFFFVKIILHLQQFHYCGYCEIFVCWCRFFRNRYIFRNGVSHTEWNLGCEMLFFSFSFLLPKIHIYSYSHCDCNSHESAVISTIRPCTARPRLWKTATTLFLTFDLKHVLQYLGQKHPLSCRYTNI